MKLLTSILALALVFTLPAFAAIKTVTLSVPGMTCATCPITVRTALKRVKGVEKVETSLERKEAVVTFDDTKTNVQALTKATKDAGYPSKVDKGSK